jgi:hypothetical protein
MLVINTILQHEHFVLFHGTVTSATHSSELFQMQQMDETFPAIECLMYSILSVHCVGLSSSHLDKALK